MFAPLADALVTATLLGALWTLVLVVANRPMLLARTPTRVFLVVLGVVELALLAQAVVSVVGSVTAELGTEAYTLAAYALTLPFVIPLTVLWGLNDRSRWGAGVVLIGLVTVPVMILRMNDVWAARG